MGQGAGRGLVVLEDDASSFDFGGGVGVGLDDLGEDVEGAVGGVVGAVGGLLDDGAELLVEEPERLSGCVYSCYNVTRVYNRGIEMEFILEKHIVSTPGVRSGKPRIAGTRVSVSDVVIWHFQMGLSLEEIAVKYNLPLAAVYAAISFYLDNKEEIDAKIEEGRIFYETNKRANPSLLEEALRRKDRE